MVGESEPIEVQILVALAEISTKLDHVISSSEDHEQRLRKVESSMASPLRTYSVPLSMFFGFASFIFAMYSAFGR